jgi:hypothetical protein
MNKIKNSLEILSFERIFPALQSTPTLEYFDLNGIYSLGVTSHSKYITVASQQRRAIALTKYCSRKKNREIKYCDYWWRLFRNNTRTLLDEPK